MPTTIKLSYRLTSCDPNKIARYILRYMPLFKLPELQFKFKFQWIFPWVSNLQYLNIAAGNGLAPTGDKLPALMMTHVTRSGAAADRRTPLKPGAQLDLASPYAVPRIRRTESPTSLNYAKLCAELNYTGAAIGEMWGDRVIRHIVLE